MSDRAPGDTAAAETRDVPAAPSPPPAPRPFSRPTPIGSGRTAASGRGTPFVAPGARRREEMPAAEPATPEPSPAQGMTWPGPAELDAAHALDAIARRLRSGSLRLPLVVDAASQPAVVASVLAALHMEGPGRPDPRADGRGPR